MQSKLERFTSLVNRDGTSRRRLIWNDMWVQMLRIVIETLLGVGPGGVALR
jgi:hypothetical protein